MDNLKNQSDDKISNEKKPWGAELPKANEDEKSKYTSKHFIPRNSLLTELFEINHIRTIYNIFIAMFFILFLNTVTSDFIETGQIHVGLKTIKYSFGKFSIAIHIWIFMKLSTFILYTAFSLWSYLHIKFVKQSISTRFFNLAFLLMFIIYQILFIIIPAIFVLKVNLPPASGLMILMEQVRMLMKTHAFVRSNAPRILQIESVDKYDGNLRCPKFSKFLYFMFAPTLIYRDEYPRTKIIRWKHVLWNFTEVGMTVFYIAFIIERFLMPHFTKFGQQIFQPQIVILTIFSMMLPGLVIFLFGFYCVLHSWQNGMAELLGFADKLFYKDWWNCTSYSDYYRRWNIIVQDWLYNYIYIDIYGKCRNKTISTLMVFLISAVFHEYIMTMTFQFFYPIMMLLFGVLGLLLFFITGKYSGISGNIFIWFGLFSGNGIMFTLYAMEYYARLNCPPYTDRIYDYLLPRSWICYKTE